MDLIALVEQEFRPDERLSEQCGPGVLRSYCIQVRTILASDT